jgi:hypothetical protein
VVPVAFAAKSWARLTRAERRIEAGRPAITVGGRRLLKARHNLADAQLTETGWRQRWQAALPVRIMRDPASTDQHRQER